MAQISQAQKDSATKLLYFKSTSFQYGIDFKPFEYLASDYKNTFNEKMSDEEILSKLNKSHQDAEAYTALCYRFFERKDMKTASQYFDKAMEGLKNWADDKPNDAKPLMMMLDLCSSTQSYQAFDNITDEALKRFPKHLGILSRIYIHKLSVQKNFKDAEELLNRALAEEPYNLQSVANWLSLQQFRYIVSLSNDASKMPKQIDISLVQKALKNNPKSLGYQHLYYYALTTRVYMNLMAKFMTKKTDDFQGVFKETSKEEKKELKEVINFFKKNLDKADKSKNTMRNNAAFANVLLGNNEEAISLFEAQYKETASRATLESIALTHFLDKNWNALKNSLDRMLEIDPNDMKILLSYMSLYEKYDKNDAKLKETIARVEQTTTSDPTRSLILATWYLKEKNLTKADFYCDLLSEDAKEALLCLAVQAVLKEDRNKALLFVEKMLVLDKEDKEALALKKVLAS
ncbi:MAG: hypothetical protein OHK0045_05510 [Raineya sp.]